MSKYIPQIFVSAVRHYWSLSKGRGEVFVGLEYMPMVVDDLLYVWEVVVECNGEWSASAWSLLFVL